MPENTAIPLERFAWRSNAKITYYANELASLFLMIIRMDKQLILSVSLIAFIVQRPLTTTKPYLDTELVSLWLSILSAYLEVKYLSPTKNRWLPLQSGYSYSSFTLYHFIKKRTSPHSKNRIRACPPFSMSTMCFSHLIVPSECGSQCRLGLQDPTHSNLTTWSVLLAPVLA